MQGVSPSRARLSCLGGDPTALTALATHSRAAELPGPCLNAGCSPACRTCQLGASADLQAPCTRAWLPQRLGASQGQWLLRLLPLCAPVALLKVLWEKAKGTIPFPLPYLVPFPCSFLLFLPAPSFFSPFFSSSSSLPFSYSSVQFPFHFPHPSPPLCPSLFSFPFIFPFITPAQTNTLHATQFSAANTKSQKSQPDCCGSSLCIFSGCTLKHGHPERAAQHHVQTVFAHLQGQRLHNLPG